MSGEHVDLSSEPEPNGPQGGGADRRRFLGVRFHCCARYAGIYFNNQATGYIGHCPGCGQRVEFKIGPGGSDSRFFSVY
jgi:hypothetical protein